MKNTHCHFIDYLQNNVVNKMTTKIRIIFYKNMNKLIIQKKNIHIFHLDVHIPGFSIFKNITHLYKLYSYNIILILFKIEAKCLNHICIIKTFFSQNIIILEY
ncbi:hypothetical protein V1477_019986 [Vespula maculifrons]|uniref:Uncharacterized protein n=1 Tax=Vespula maculifrons TaxID=7453 RepID=A0ABD2AKM4_VESMC